MTKPTRKASTKATSKDALSNASLTPAPKQTATAQAPSTTKQNRVLEMLRSGATIAEMMQETGWQQHSIRGFLAGVVRKKLRLNLQAKKVDGGRIYRIASGAKTKPLATSRKRRV